MEISRRSSIVPFSFHAKDLICAPGDRKHGAGLALAIMAGDPAPPGFEPTPVAREDQEIAAPAKISFGY